MPNRRRTSPSDTTGDPPVVVAVAHTEDARIITRTTNVNEVRPRLPVKTQHPDRANNSKLGTNPVGPYSATVPISALNRAMAASRV